MVCKVTQVHNAISFDSVLECPPNEMLPRGIVLGYSSALVEVWRSATLVESSSHATARLALTAPPKRGRDSATSIDRNDPGPFKDMKSKCMACSREILFSASQQDHFKCVGNHQQPK